MTEYVIPFCNLTYPQLHGHCALTEMEAWDRSKFGGWILERVQIKVVVVYLVVVGTMRLMPLAKLELCFFTFDLPRVKV